MLAAAVEELLADGLCGRVEGPHSQAHQVIQVQAAPLRHLLAQGGWEHTTPTEILPQKRVISNTSPT